MNSFYTVERWVSFGLSLTNLTCFILLSLSELVYSGKSPIGKIKIAFHRQGIPISLTMLIRSIDMYGFYQIYPILFHMTLKNLITSMLFYSTAEWFAIMINLIYNCSLKQPPAKLHLYSVRIPSAVMFVLAIVSNALCFSKNVILYLSIWRFYIAAYIGALFLLVCYTLKKLLASMVVSDKRKASTRKNREPSVELSEKSESSVSVQPTGKRSLTNPLEFIGKKFSRLKRSESAVLRNQSGNYRDKKRDELKRKMIIAAVLALFIAVVEALIGVKMIRNGSNAYASLLPDPATPTLDPLLLVQFVLVVFMVYLSWMTEIRAVFSTPVKDFVSAIRKKRERLA